MKTQAFTPPVKPTPTTGSTLDAVLRNAAEAPDEEVIAVKRGETWAPVTTTAFLAEVQAVAKGIIAAGIHAGDRVAVMSRTRYEWTVVDYAIWYAGAVSVPIYETSSAEQVQWILSDSGAVAIFAESFKNRETFNSIARDVPAVQHVWVFDDGALSHCRDGGAGVSDEELESRRATLTPESLATIIYTSGTTGRPKGCMLSHKNIMYVVDAIVYGLPDLFLAKGSSTVLFLPVAHVFGRLIQAGCVSARVKLGHCPDTRLLLGDLATFQPTFVLSVPRVFEKIFNSSQAKAEADGKGHIFATAAATAIAYSESLDTGGPGFLLKVKHTLFDKLVYSKIRKAMGGHVRFAVSGGAPLGARLGHFFRGIGVTILEGYGLTETTAPGTVNRNDALRIGTVGQPIPGSWTRTAEDGEVLMKGDHIFMGYWNNEAATTECMDGEWFRSGDIGVIDDDGFLTITGRKKELLVTAGGKNVAPAVLEDRLRAHFLVSQCIVVGDAKPFIGALVTIDPEAFPAWLKANNKPDDLAIADAVDDPELNAAIQAAVADANKAVSNAEAIKKFRILPVDWTEEGGQLTPSLKLKRNVVMNEFADEVNSLYS